MRGYKALNKGLVNRYGYKYELNRKYILNGELKWRENGFHFCTRPEDTLRYVDSWGSEIDVVEIEGSGELQLYEDDYYGYYDMYASTEIILKRIVPREELFRMIIDSNDDERVRRFVSSLELTSEEINTIRELYPRVNDTIDYYQNEETILKLKSRF